MSHQESKTLGWFRATTFVCIALAIAMMGPLVSQAETSDREALTASLRAAEVAFAKTVEDGDIEAFASFIAEDAVFSGSGKSFVGREAIVEAWSFFFAPESPKISWHPESVVLAPDGTIGANQGPYRVVHATEGGGSKATQGTFFSVWRRVDGEWKIILDNGTEAKPEPVTKKWEGAFEGLEWLEGRWVGEGFGGQAEETWSSPLGGAMTGSFRLVHGDSPSVYEFFTLAPVDGKLELRLKHFHGDMKGWEEKDEMVVFPFLAKGDDFLRLDGLRYFKDGDDGMRAEVDIERDGEIRTEKLSFKRAPM